MNKSIIKDLREIDALVAEHVMGKAVNEYSMTMMNLFYINKTDHPMVITPENIPNYSTDISSAWDVVEKLKENHWHFDLTRNHDEWYVLLDHQTHGEEVIANSASLAICLAALKAKGISIESVSENALSSTQP